MATGQLAGPRRTQFKVDYLHLNPEHKNSSQLGIKAEDVVLQMGYISTQNRVPYVATCQTMASHPCSILRLESFVPGSIPLASEAKKEPGTLNANQVSRPQSRDLGLFKSPDGIGIHASPRPPSLKLKPKTSGFRV